MHPPGGSLQSESSLFVESFAALSLLYHVAAPRCTSAKQLSWILTVASSLIMTLVSLPFLWDHITTGSLLGIQHRPTLTVAACRFFQAYLLSDLTHGIVYYRSNLTLSTGWFHHTIYVFIVELALRRSVSHVFCAACILELPTFLLGLGSLFPQLRSNLLFAASFFSTRICYHALLAVSLYTRNSRVNVAGGSYIPAIIFTLVFPMHAIWFVGCIKGFIRRAGLAEKRHPTTIPTGIPPLVSQPSANGRVQKLIPPVLRRYQYYRARLSQRRQALRQTVAYQMIPGREKVFEYIGLGRQFQNLRK